MTMAGSGGGVAPDRDPNAVQQFERQCETSFFGNAGVSELMDKEGIDWTIGPAHPRDGSTSLRLGVERGSLTAGSEDEVKVTVTNLGSRTLYQVGAVALDHELLDGREFLFGRLEPNEQRTFSTPVRSPAAGRLRCSKESHRDP